MLLYSQEDYTSEYDEFLLVQETMASIFKTKLGENTFRIAFEM